MIKTVGIVDDTNCDLHINGDETHIESSNRTKYIRKYLEKTGLLDKLEKISPSNVKKEDILCVHSLRHLDKVINKCDKNVSTMVDCEDVYVNGKNSLISSFAAIGSVIGAVDYLLNSDNKTDVKQIFCNVRPPGHHACSDKAAGFCLFNNVAIGVAKALKYPNINKVLIFDWDLHHGDGTQKIFYDNVNVMYCSFHREAPFYPNDGFKEQTGYHSNILNYPLKKNITSSDYLKLFNDDFLPKAQQFNPDLVFISCGFDSHKDDTYHELPLDYPDYNYMTTKLIKLSKNNLLISVLEGGYNPDIIGKCVINHINTMLNYELLN